MAKLIPLHSAVIDGNQIQSCNARDLHKFLEVGKDFSTWIKDRIDQYGFEEGKDFSPILGKSQGGRPSVEYAISLDMAKELAMVERNEKGKQARQYFIECERKAKQVASPTALANPTGATRAHLMVVSAMQKIGVRKEMAMAVALKAIHEDTGLTTEPYRLALPVVEEVCNLNQKQLGDLIGVSAREIGKQLRAHGLMEDDESGQRVLTELGRQYGEMKPFSNNGHSGYEPRWKKDVLDFITEAA